MKSQHDQRIIGDLSRPSRLVVKLVSLCKFFADILALFSIVLEACEVV